MVCEHNISCLALTSDRQRGQVEDVSSQGGHLLV